MSLLHNQLCLGPENLTPQPPPLTWLLLLTTRLSVISLRIPLGWGWGGSDPRAWRQPGDSEGRAKGPGEVVGRFHQVGPVL